ncbi:serine hydrolase [Flavivirga eckloniae]|uniref:Beta-lactamase-related domain-containing protein n=1 Tax=Flavivirga eckloniae TaxID=1803846 RepID=A0A2K9PR03_9FLAO|nr:serine hydrolase [Flavivirga eckloniae]AUP79258.1 hypothetical protein C1H87_11310 [Flavivirga eckloniae]
MKKIIFLLALVMILSCEKKRSTSSHNSKITEITNYLDSLKDFSGAVLIVKNDSILLQKAYGYAHMGHKIVNNVDTKFNQGSIGKSFTAVAILQLIQQNKLKLTDNVGAFIPEYPNKIVRDSVTIAYLLTHTSGLPHFFARETFLKSSKDLYRTMNDLNPLYENEPMESKPGEIFTYRNTNYVILGRIIEKISGLEYDEYLEKNIYALASMKNTGNFDLDHPIDNAAEGYTTSEVYPDKLKINIHTYPSKGNAAGGGYTTLNDLYHFAQAIQNNKLLNSEYTTLFTTPLSKNNHYGYGMQFPNPEEGTIFGHSGGHFGVGSEWRVYTKEGYTVILLTNKDTDKGFLDARFSIQKILSGTTPSIEKHFNTKAVFDEYYKNGFEVGVNKINSAENELDEYTFIVNGYNAISAKKLASAIEIFRLGIIAFPNSYNMYDSLGEAYLENGQMDLAVTNYKKSLELNPENENAKEKLIELSLNK